MRFGILSLVAVMVCIGGLFLAAFVYSVPLLVVFIPTTIVTLVTIAVAVLLIFGCVNGTNKLVQCCAPRRRRIGHAMGATSKKMGINTGFRAQILKVSIFLAPGWIIYFAVMYSHFYHGQGWNEVFDYSLRFLNFSAKGLGK